MDTKPCLLLIDDEERILRSLAMLFRGQYRVQTTTDPQTALNIVAREAVHVVISDQRMPLMRGADLLREVKRASPNTMRILLTGYSELEAVAASINEGEIFRFISKPWNAADLRGAVDQAAGIALPLFAAPPAAVAAAVPPAPSIAAAGSGILVIDDDASVPAAIREIAGPAQPVYHARSLDQAFGLLEAESIGVIISELRVAHENLAPVLKLLKAQHPEVVTIVMTLFDDHGVLVDLINQGQIFRLLPKPLRRGPLSMSIASALRQHRLLQESPVLRRRHAVERIRAPEELSVANRVMGFLGRLRARATA